MRGYDADLIEYKSAELGQRFVPPNPYHKDKLGYFRWHSACSPVLEEFYHMLYRNGRRYISTEVLDSLRDIGLAIWFLDAGSIKKDSVVIRTGFYDTVLDYFEKLGLTGTTEYKRVILDPESTKTFLKIIGPCVPEGLTYRLVCC